MKINFLKNASDLFNGINWAIHNPKKTLLVALAILAPKPFFVKGSSLCLSDCEAQCERLLQNKALFPIENTFNYLSVKEFRELGFEVAFLSIFGLRNKTHMDIANRFHKLAHLKSLSTEADEFAIIPESNLTDCSPMPYETKLLIDSLPIQSPEKAATLAKKLQKISPEVYQNSTLACFTPFYHTVEKVTQFLKNCEKNFFHPLCLYAYIDLSTEANYLKAWVKNASIYHFQKIPLRKDMIDLKERIDQNGYPLDQLEALERFRLPIVILTVSSIFACWFQDTYLFLLKPNDRGEQHERLFNAPILKFSFPGI